ncbi:hypothetical protein BIS06_22295, partial [Halomonas sp. BBD48]|nr:hypothetical protein [Halomonas sp. BBD48]
MATPERYSPPVYQRHPSPGMSQTAVASDNVVTSSQWLTPFTDKFAISQSCLRIRVGPATTLPSEEEGCDMKSLLKAIVFSLLL